MRAVYMCRIAKAFETKGRLVFAYNTIYCENDGDGDVYPSDTTAQQGLELPDTHAR